MSTTASEAPTLDKVDSQLFQLMRDEVIVGLYRGLSGRWVCLIKEPDAEVILSGVGTATREFTSAISALDAYTQAFSYLVQLRLQGKDIYTKAALKRRDKMGV